jgi:hypothetical protein
MSRLVARLHRLRSPWCCHGLPPPIRWHCKDRRTGTSRHRSAPAGRRTAHSTTAPDRHRPTGQADRASGNACRRQCRRPGFDREADPGAVRAPQRDPSRRAAAASPRRGGTHPQDPRRSRPGPPSRSVASRSPQRCGSAPGTPDRALWADEAAHPARTSPASDGGARLPRGPPPVPRPTHPKWSSRTPADADRVYESWLLPCLPHMFRSMASTSGGFSMSAMRSRPVAIPEPDARRCCQPRLLSSSAQAVSQRRHASPHRRQCSCIPA